MGGRRRRRNREPQSQERLNRRLFGEALARATRGPLVKIDVGKTRPL